jgi:hypothetical protein
MQNFCFISLFYSTFSYTTVWIELMEKHVISEESLSSSTVVGSLSYYLFSVLIFSITAIDANSNNFKKSTNSLSTVIGLPFHGRQNFKKLGYEIPAPRSPLTY